jgi:four helix bundle protein
MQKIWIGTPITSNIVEGCARFSESEYIHFLDIAYGSSREVEYQLSRRIRLQFLTAMP